MQNHSMSKKPSSSKDETYWKILNCALDLEVKKGHLKWTLSELSRHSGVTRSLIYYYFGRSHQRILEDAVSIMGQELIGLNDSRSKMWKERRWHESLTLARHTYEKAPNMCLFYMSHRNKANSIGIKLKELEKSFIQKIKKFKPELSHEMCNTIFAIFFGITFSPHVNNGEIECFAKMIDKIMH
jgi:AcrR family transcriptional regulator